MYSAAVAPLPGSAQVAPPTATLPQAAVVTERLKEKLAAGQLLPALSTAASAAKSAAVRALTAPKAASALPKGGTMTGTV